MPLHREYEERWSKAGYQIPMGSSAVTLPPPKTHLRLYHFTSEEYAISDLALGRLKVARFSDANDPFELLSLRVREAAGRTVLRKYKETFDEETGLICFSADWINPLLWSHYASKHKGICLGFDVKRSILQQVKYEDERIRAELGENADVSALDEELKSQLVCTKSHHWSYEQEARIFVELDKATHEGSLYFYPFGQHLRLAEVILGPRCRLSLEVVRKLTSSLYPDAVTFRAKLSIKRFAILPKEKTVPQIRVVD